MKQILTYIKKNQKGMTLLELVVTFALLVIFMTAAVATIAPAMNVFNSVMSMSRAQSVSNIVMEKVVGEIENATADVKIRKDGTQIAYTNRDAYSVIMYAGTDHDNEDSALQLHYQSIRSVADPNQILQEAVDWNYPKKTYLNNEVKELTFKKVDASKNLIQVSVTIKSKISGKEYTRTKTVRCYKLNADDITSVEADEFPQKQ